MAAAAEPAGAENVQTVAFPSMGGATALQESLQSFMQRLSGPASSSTATSSGEIVASLNEQRRSLVSAVMDFGLMLWQRHSNMIQEFEDSQLPLSHTLPVFTVGVIMGSLYFTFVHMYMPAVHMSSSSLTSLVFHGCFGMGMASYYQAVYTDPGVIPDSWRGEPDGRPLFALQNGVVFEPLERKRKTGYHFRYCNKEKKFKPDRAHFCSGMSRNVLRMDHFCPWIMNCVGFKNHKFFVLFLLYTVIATNVAWKELVFALLRGIPSAGHTFLMWEGSCISLLLASVLTPFFGFHCWMIANNMTTIEFCEGRCDMADGRQSLYDIGMWRNIQSVMGKEWYLWLFPVGGPPGDGISWEVNPEVAQQVLASIQSARGPLSTFRINMLHRSLEHDTPQDPQEDPPEEAEQPGEVLAPRRLGQGLQVGRSEPVSIVSPATSSTAAPPVAAAPAAEPQSASALATETPSWTQRMGFLIQRRPHCGLLPLPTPSLPSIPRFIPGAFEALKEIAEDVVDQGVSMATAAKSHATTAVEQVAVTAQQVQAAAGTAVQQAGEAVQTAGSSAGAVISERASAVTQAVAGAATSAASAMSSFTLRSPAAPSQASPAPLIRTTVSGHLRPEMAAAA